MHPLLTKERNSYPFHFEKGSANRESSTEKFDGPQVEFNEENSEDLRKSDIAFDGLR